MAKYPGLAAISGGFTIESYRPYSGPVGIRFSGSFPQLLTTREAKKLNTWLSKFITASDEERAQQLDEAANAEG